MLYCPAVTKNLIIACCALSLLACTGCMMPNREVQTAKNEDRIAAEGIIKLETGAAAPAISAASTADQFELSAKLAEGQRVLLFFFPAIDTPNSTRELVALNKDLGEYRTQQISVYGITGATIEELTAYRAAIGIEFDLVADPDLKIAQAYGCALPDGKFAQRTNIGINPDGAIAFFIRHQMLKAEVLEGFGLNK